MNIIPFPLKHHSIRGAIQLGLRERNSPANHINKKSLHSSAVDFEVVHADGQPLLLRDIEGIGATVGSLLDFVLSNLPKILNGASWSHLGTSQKCVTEARYVIDRSGDTARVTLIVGVADSHLAPYLCQDEKEVVSA